MKAREIRPIVFTLFGITGDLTKKKILPAFFSLQQKKLLPEDFSIVGFGRKDFSKTEFSDYIKETLKKQKGVEDFLSIISYIKGDFSDVSSYKELFHFLSDLDKNKNKCFSKIFYLAVLPELYYQIFDNINKSGLSVICHDVDGKSFSRLLVEKPFGTNLDSFQKLNLLSNTIFSKDQIYRVDHYNAKSFWDDIRKFDFEKEEGYIEKIEINLFEKSVLEDRVSFYEPLGAIYDVFQSHILQMIAFLISEKDKIGVLKKLKLQNDYIVRGQYIGYRKHQNSNENSDTETFFSTKFLYNKIPIYIRSGKGLSENILEIVVYKKNGEKIEIKSNQNENNAYEKIILKAISGEKDIFVGEEELLLSWQISEKLKAESKKSNIVFYNIGENPAELKS